MSIPGGYRRGHLRATVHGLPPLRSAVIKEAPVGIVFDRVGRTQDKLDALGILRTRAKAVVIAGKVFRRGIFGCVIIQVNDDIDGAVVGRLNLCAYAEPRIGIERIGKRNDRPVQEDIIVFLAGLPEVSGDVHQPAEVECPTVIIHTAAQLRGISGDFAAGQCEGAFILNVHAAALLPRLVPGDFTAGQGECASADQYAAAVRKAIAAGDFTTPCAAVHDGQVAQHKDDFAIFDSLRQPPVDGAAVQVEGQRAPGLHHKGFFTLLGRDAVVGVGKVADLYGVSGGVADGVLQGLPWGGTRDQARLAAPILGIADVVAHVIALEERKGRHAFVVINVFIGKLAGVLHPHADLRAVPKRAVLQRVGDGEGLAVRQVQVAVRASGDSAVGRAGAAHLVFGDHRPAGEADRASAAFLVQVNAAALFPGPVAGNLAARHVEGAVHIDAAAVSVVGAVAIGAVFADKPAG